MLNTTITEVKKEIANIREAMHQYYRNFKIATFTKEDLDKTVKAFPNPRNSDNKSLIFFELDEIPEPNSVTLAANDGMVSFSTFHAWANIVAFKLGHHVEEFFNNEKITFYEIRYVPDYFSEIELYTIEDMKYEVDEKNWITPKFKKR